MEAMSKTITIIELDEEAIGRLKMLTMPELAALECKLVRQEKWSFGFQHRNKLGLNAVECEIMERE